MSAEFEVPKETQTNILESEHKLVAKIGLALGRLALVSGLALGSAVLEDTSAATLAHADSVGDALSGYPYKSMPCEHANSNGQYSSSGYCPNYDWGPTHTTVYGDPSTNSERGFGYRNCTDWVAYRLNQLTGIVASSSLGNGGDWYNNAPASERSLTPKAWDAAVIPATYDANGNETNYGHVAFVESVSGDGKTMTISEYNYDAMGDGDQRTVPVAGSAFSEFVDFGAHPAGSEPNAYGPAMVQRPQTGETDIAAVGANNELDFYFNSRGSQAWNKVVVSGSGSAYSSPAMIQRPSGETDIAVQGPNHELDFYFNPQGSSSWGHVRVDETGMAYGSPAVLQRPNGETDIAVEGPNDSLDFYFNKQGSSAWSKLKIGGNGSTFSSPAMIQRSTGETDIALQGPNQELDFYFNKQGSLNWGKTKVSGNGSTFSSPAMIQRSTGETDLVIADQKNNLDFYFNSQGSQNWGESTVGNALSEDQPAVIQRQDGETDVAAYGQGGELDFYYNAQGSKIWGKATISK